VCVCVRDVEGEPVGGVILNYLLEKSRVVRQTAGEENFHVFYELIYGADPSLLSSLQLTADVDDYHYTRSQVSYGFASVCLSECLSRVCIAFRQTTVEPKNNAILQTCSCALQESK